MMKKKKSSKVVFVEEKKQSDSFAKSKIIPKTAQDTLPFDEVYENGIFRKDNTFCLMFGITNIDYKIKRENEQDLVYTRYAHMHTILPHNIRYQEFIMNYPADIKALEAAMIPNKSNGINDEVLDDYKDVMSNVIKKSVKKSCDERIIGAISFTPQTKLEDVSNTLTKNFEALQNQALEINSELTLLTPENSFELLHRLFHLFDNEPFLLPDDVMQHDVTLKDYIVPSQFKFRNKLIEVGSSYSAVLFVKHISKTCDDEFITDLLDNTYNICISKHIQKIDKSEALKILKRQMDDLEGRLEKRREINKKHGGEFIPFALQSRENALKATQEKLGDSNTDLFTFAIYVYVSAPTEDALNDLIMYVRQKGLAHQVKIDILTGTVHQEAGLHCVLPFANPPLTSEGQYIGQPYYLLTNEIANFIPFSYHNVFSVGGIYYGINRVTYSPIIIDRSNNLNGNSFILGTSGSGKSMDVKSEMYAAMAKYPNDEFFVIDPENEYSPLLKPYGKNSVIPFEGEIVKISPNTNTYINLFDTDLSYIEEGSNAINLKSDFIMTFIEVAKGVRLTATEKSIIDRCVKIVYQNYQRTGNKDDIPTLKEFYECISKQQELEAKDIALTLELFVNGSFNIFSHKTNIEYHKKFIIFDIFDMGKQLETVGNLVLLELLWQRVIENKKRGIRTWVWTDEFSIMFNDSNSDIFSTGDFFVKVYKRIRKHGGNASGATQNITEVLESKQAMTMLSNSDFVMLLAQKKSDLKHIVQQWDLSESQAKYLDTDKPGTGLIISGKTIVPFENIIPKESFMYEICTTKFADLQKQIKDRGA